MTDEEHGTPEKRRESLLSLMKEVEECAASLEEDDRPLSDAMSGLAKAMGLMDEIYELLKK